MPVLGKIGLVNRGTYSASATYTALDFVLYEGSSYVALKSVKNIPPSNDGTNWQILAEGTAASLYLENSLDYVTVGKRALDAAQGPIIKELIDAKADTNSVPPKSHASTATTYGIGTAASYGHTKVSDTYSSRQASAAAANGVAASQNALYNAYANRSPVNHASTGTTYGQSNASNYGHVKLSDTYATKQSSAAAANGVAASQNALYEAYNSVNGMQETTISGVTFSRRGGVCTVYGNAAAVSSFESVTVPVGYRPRQGSAVGFVFVASSSQGYMPFGTVWISSAGKITIYLSSGDKSYSGYIYLTYVARDD